MLSVAPMMDVTDRHHRYLVRRMTRRALLYTEMVVAQAIRHGDRERLLGFHPDEHPVALQLGGDDPELLAEAAAIAQDFGYDEVNLNVGCPSPRVQSGSFGVVLMKTPDKVARAVEAMRRRVSIPVTVKHRIGVDDLDAYDDMLRFVDVVAEAGAERFTVHARKAWLDGLSPKENRDIPPLRYGDVYRLKAERPHLHVEINGGVKTLDEVVAHLRHVDAVMLGRAARDTPYVLAEVDQRLYGDDRPVVDRAEVARAMLPYLEQWVGRPHFKLHHVTRHLGALYTGVRGARAFKRTLAEANRLGPGVIEAALRAVEEARLGAV